MNDKSLAMRLLLLGALLIYGGTVLAQSNPAQPLTRYTVPQIVVPKPAETFQPPTEQELELLKRDLRSQRKQIIAANIKLTETEAEKFWPIYDQYAAEIAKTDDKKFSLIKVYQENYATLTGEQAAKYIKGRAEVDDSIVDLRVKYFPIFLKAVPAKKTALFFQVDRRLWLMIDLQIASQNPLITP